jgi:hypothetical protein
LEVIECRRRDRSAATIREKQLDIMGILLAPTKDDAGHEILLDNISYSLVMFARIPLLAPWRGVLKFLCDSPDVLDRLRKKHLERFADERRERTTTQ